MYRENKQVLTHDDHRFILSQAALGDMITSLPAIIHARKTNAPIMRMTVYVPPWQIDLVRHLLAQYGVFEVRDLNEVPDKFDSDERAEWRGEASVSQNSAVQNTHTRNRQHMVDYAFAYLIDALPESVSQRNYPTAAPLGSPIISGNYVVFPVGATSDNKLFKASVMAPIIQWCIDHGYQPVLVGTKMSFTRAQMGDKLGEQLVIRDEVDKLPGWMRESCIDMREKTNLLSLRNILGYAEAVVGVDGGTLHLAGTTDVPIVYAMGTTLPKHRYIPRHGDHNFRIKYVVPRDLECAGCQSNWQMTRWDFRLCVYDDNKCMTALHPDDFIDGLKELGL